MAEGEYVYCIIPKKNVPNSFEVKGFEDNAVYTIPFKNLCVVASNATVKNYEPTDENISIHKDVSLHVMKNHSVLPVAFGQVFKNKAILLHNIRKTYLVLLRSMLAMNNKIELGVKAVIPKDTNPEELFNGKRDEARKEIEAEFSQALSKLAIKEKSNKLFSEKLVVNQSYLIDKNKLDEFSKKIAELTERFSKLKIQYTGPWPPFNFVNIRIAGGR
ncbi:MAG: GvpL/GvpF family gas vesicle protein [Candidatus Micrarchaeota archaeon]